jgi:hypothetical protein
MKKLILVVIDGLTPGLLEAALESGRAPTLARLAEHGTLRRAVSAFPSLTPVCLSSIATGALPDVHRVPHLVWYDRREGRLVEYGSSFAAVRAAGFGRSLQDTILNMNRRHLSQEAVTVFEALEDAGLVTASVNFTCYRGHHRHPATLPGLPAAYGPRRFFYYSLFESDPTGAPLAVRNRAAGTIDAYAAAVGRWLVTRDGFDLLVFYLSDLDFASHVLGPDGVLDALVRCDEHVGRLAQAAGGIDGLLERYGVAVFSDHGQTRVERAVDLRPRYAGRADALVTASNRAAMVYALDGDGQGADARELALPLEAEPDVEVVLFREGDEAVARREREELRFAPEDGGWRTSGDESILEGPDAHVRAWAALANPNAGEVLACAAPGVEFVDLAGRHHAGGGSHGSLSAGDSEVPVLTAGLDWEPSSIVDIAPLALAHFGVEPPPYARSLSRVA